jgi:serpin B
VPRVPDDAFPVVRRLSKYLKALQDLPGTLREDARAMRTRTFVAPVVLLLLCSVAGCEASTSGGGNPPGNPGPTNPTGPSNPESPGPVAQSTLARTAASTIPQASLESAVSANNTFAVGLYGQALAATSSSGSNFLTSPVSASLALTMTYAGAVGTTATQMASTLGFGSSTSTIFDGQNALSQALNGRAAAALAADTQTASGSGEPAPDPSNYALQVVNSVWGEQTYTWNTPFLNVLAQSYGTGVRLSDFINQPDPSRVTINNWVSTETANKINNLLPQGSIDDNTRMVLVNAIHLKLPWANAFDPSATANQTFTTGAGASVSNPFMNQTLTTSYTDDGKAQIIGLPLAGGQLSVVIALPHGSLASYEAGLSATSAGLAQPTAQAQVQLALPKFSFTSPTFSLANSLKAMGITQAFDPVAANFTGMCTHTPDGDNLYIGDVLQKAMIAVQETGVEAAAATAVLVAGDAAEGPTPPPPVPMVVDRPFLISIVDVPTGAVLFLGQIEDPTDAGGS